MKSVGLLIVGDEVLSGEVRDENGPWVVARLASVGARVPRLAVVPDGRPEIVEELTRLRARSDAVLVSGGIGPTHDDLTRPAVAEALGVPLEEHPDASARVREWFGDRATSAEREMAMLPRGARVLRGPRTGTLGFSVAGVYVLPGVPVLFRDLVDGSIADFSGPALHRVEATTVLREGEIADDLRRLQAAALDVAIGSYPSLGTEGGWTTRVVVRSLDPSRAHAVAEAVRAAFLAIESRRPR